MTAIVPGVEREGNTGDLNLVYDSWLRSYRKSQPEMRDTDYYAFQRRRIDRILRGSGFLRIIHPTGAPSVIAAWACLDVAPSVAHYVYVQQEYRRRGFARELLIGRGVATHLTDGGRLLKRLMELRYLPHLLDGPL